MRDADLLPKIMVRYDHSCFELDHLKSNIRVDLVKIYMIGYHRMLQYKFILALIETLKTREKMAGPESQEIELS